MNKQHFVIGNTYSRHHNKITLLDIPGLAPEGQR